MTREEAKQAYNSRKTAKELAGEILAKEKQKTNIFFVNFLEECEADTEAMHRRRVKLLESLYLRFSANADNGGDGMKRTKAEINETVKALKMQIKNIDEAIEAMEKAGHDCPNTKQRREWYKIAVEALEECLEG